MRVIIIHFSFRKYDEVIENKNTKEISIEFNKTKKENFD